MPRRITIRDIAERAGVHYSTVSLALRDSPKVGLEVRAHIRAIADEMGYIPDPAMAALSAYRNAARPVQYQSTIAWINNWPVRDEMRRTVPAFNRYFLGAAARAQELGFKIEDFWLHAPGMTPSGAQAILRTRGIKGLIVAPQPHARTPLDLDLSEFTSLALGYSLQPAHLHVVTNHQYQAMQLAIHELQALGYRRIGLYLLEDIDEKVNNNFLSVLLFSQHRIPARRRVPPLLDKGGTPEVFHHWVKKHRPDVVITVNRYLRLWVRELGLGVPEDIGIAHLNADPADPWHAGIHQNDTLVGATAVDFLAGMLQRNERGIPATPIRTLVEGVWKPGPSVRDMHAAPKSQGRATPRKRRSS